jgi:hypothetical protein
LLTTLNGMLRFRGNRVAHAFRRSDRHRALVDDHGVLVHRPADLGGDSQDVLQVGRPVLALGRSDRDEDEVRGAHRRMQVRRERQTLFVVVAADDLLEARLVDRHPAGFEHVDFRGILVDADDGIAVFREARTQDKPHVPGSDHGDFHFTIRY